MRAVLRVVACTLALALALAAAGCGTSPGTPDTGGGPPLDSGARPDVPGHDAWMAPPPQDGGSCMTAADCPGSYCNGGSHTCCVPAVPPFEICGDHIDQNCDGHDESCGDNDMDNWQACMPVTPPAMVDFTMCDCDDTDPGTYPARGNIPGGAELCDHKDNDCDGVIDESPMCCTGCMALPSTNQADVCVGGGPSGMCSCSTNAGGAPCPTGQSCCTNGCIDTSSDIMNCGFCGAACTAQNDNCTAGQCHCGTGPSCAYINMCVAGACQ